MIGLIICATIALITTYCLNFFSVLPDAAFWFYMGPITLILLRLYNLIGLSAIKIKASNLINNLPDLFTEEEQDMLLESSSIYLTPFLFISDFAKSEMAAQNFNIGIFSVLYSICSFVWGDPNLKYIMIGISMAVFLISFPLHLWDAFYQTAGKTPQECIAINFVSIIRRYSRRKKLNPKNISTLEMQHCELLMRSINWKLNKVF